MRNLHLLLFTSIFFLCCSSSELANSTGKDFFQWDFSSNKKYIYLFNQTSNMVFDDLTTNHKNEMPSIMKANLNIRVKSQEYADLSLTEVKIIDKEFSTSNESGEDSPSMVIQDMDPKGKFKTENQDMLFKLILPLPSKNLKIGESDFMQMEIPFTTNGSVLFSKGGTTLTYAKDTLVNSESLAKLTAVTDISKLDIPEEIEGVFEMSTTASSSFLFNKEKGCFVKAFVEFKMESYTEIEEEIGGNIHNMKNRMTMISTVDIDLLEIVE